MPYIKDLDSHRSFTPPVRAELTNRIKNRQDAEDRSFWRNLLSFLPGSDVLERAEIGSSYIIVSGWIVEIAQVEGGRDQVISFQLSGDIIHASSTSSNRRFVALTKVEIGNVNLIEGDEGAQWQKKISRAQSRIEELLFNHLVRMGRLNAEERLLHLLLEFNDRLEAAGLAKGASYRLPVTQQMLGDALGLSLVHINRTLQELRRRKLLTLRRGHVTLHDRGRLANMACYEPSGPDAGAPSSSQGRSEFGRSTPSWADSNQSMA